MQAYFLVSDDIMDASITRRGQPCWYRIEDVGFMAVNDALILEGAIFQMIRKHFRKESFYVDIIDLLHEVRYAPSPLSKSLNLLVQVSYQTEMGQLVDLITAPEHSVDLSKFSLSRCVLSPDSASLFDTYAHASSMIHRHSTIVIYKTAYYSFYL